MRVYVVAVYLFLYLPIGIIVLFSFSAGRNASSYEGFSTQWYGRAFNNPFVLDALRTSLTVAFATAVMACLFGTMAALALQNVKGRMRVLYDAMIYIAIMIPGIVIGISTLVALVTVFDLVNPVIAGVWPGEAPPRLAMGYASLIAAHTLFTMALVIVIVRARIAGMDRALIEASQDLYATPWATFWRVTFPQLLPAILAGFLLSFTFSFDDFIVAFFTAGQDQTLPMFVFASIRRGVTPAVNAIATVLLTVTITSLVAAWLVAGRRRRSGAPAPTDAPAVPAG
jgi:spermidine/putrescine transport system permease protein